MSQHVSELKQEELTPAEKEFQIAQTLEHQFFNKHSDIYQDKSTFIQFRNIYVAAADKGHIDAATKAAYWFVKGYQTSTSETSLTDLKKARKYYKKATSKNTSEELFNYCYFLWKYPGFLEEAEFLSIFEALKPTEEDHFHAILLADLYEFGVIDKNKKRIIPQNNEECFRLYNKAQSIEPSYTKPGFYSTGFAKHLLYYGKDALAQGKGFTLLENGANLLEHATAACELAIYLESQKRYQQAAHYYKLAIKLNDHDAPLFLGQMLEDGFYKEEEKEKTSRYYYELAFDRGNLAAKEKLLQFDPGNSRFTKKPEVKTEIVEKEKPSEPVVIPTTAKENIDPVIVNTSTQTSSQLKNNQSKKSANSSFNNVASKLKKAQNRRAQRKEAQQYEPLPPPPPKTAPKEKQTPSSLGFSIKKVTQLQLKEFKTTFKLPEVEELFECFLSEQKNTTSISTPDFTMKINPEAHKDLELAEIDSLIDNYHLEAIQEVKLLQVIAIMNNMFNLIKKGRTELATKLHYFLAECCALNPKLFEMLLERYLPDLRTIEQPPLFLLSLISFAVYWPSNAKIKIANKLLGLGFKFAHPIQQYAAQGKQEELLAEIKKMDPRLDADKIESALHFAGAYNQIPLLKILSTKIPIKKKQEQSNALSTAFRTGNLDACNVLIQLKINTQDFENPQNDHYKFANFIGDKNLQEWLKKNFGERLFVPAMFKATHTAIKPWKNENPEHIEALKVFGQFKPGISSESSSSSSLSFSQPK